MQDPIKESPDRSVPSRRNVQRFADSETETKRPTPCCDTGGRTGFTCWTEPGGVPSGPRSQSRLSIHPRFLIEPLVRIPRAVRRKKPRNDKVSRKSNVAAVDSRTHEWDIEGYLELLKLLLREVLVDENADAYDKLMRAEYESGEMGYGLAGACRKCCEATMRARLRSSVPRSVS